MKKVHLIITGMEGSLIKATSILFNEENQRISVEEIEYSDMSKKADILEMLSIEDAEVWETHIRGGGIKRKK